MDINTFAWYFVPSFIFGELAIQTLRDWRQGQRKFPTRDVIGNFAIGIGDRLFTKVLWTGIMYAAFSYIFSTVTPFRVDMNQWWAWPLAIALSDFAFYWYHRAGHEIRAFWAVHNVHHSSQHYNFSTSVRLSWFEGMLRWPFWVILPLAGFTPEVSLTAYMIVRLFQVLLHTEHVGKLGCLEWIFSTPSAHRVHHGRNPQYLDKNYGGITIIWDRLFGTYAAEEETVDYGLVKQLETKHIVSINFHEFQSLARDMKAATGLRQRLQYLIKPPGWKAPEGEPQGLVLG